MTENEKFMKKAVSCAEIARRNGDIPIGCIIVKDGKVISRGYNKKEVSGIPTRHAEIEAIEKAAKKLGDWRLNGCEMYVTLEPCIMCSGAIVNSRIKKLYFGAYDAKSGGVETLYNILWDKRLNHLVETQGGVLEEECAKLLTDFFVWRRKTKKVDNN